MGIQPFLTRSYYDRPGKNWIGFDTIKPFKNSKSPTPSEAKEPASITRSKEELGSAREI